MSARIASAVLGVGLAAALLGGCAARAERPVVPFAPYGEGYAEKPDFARVEHEWPLSLRDRARLTPENVALLTQEEVDQVYARLTAGPIPHGPYAGAFFLAEGGGLRRLAEVLGAIEGFPVAAELARLEGLAAALWRGRVFDRDARLVRAAVEPAGAPPSLSGIDPAKLRRQTLAGRDVVLLFPAKLYCGQSRLDSRRESIVLDHAFNDEVEGYLSQVDSLAGRNGLKVRDEIRRVRPGFYLGRAYLGRIFALNFTLYDAEAAERELPAFLAGGAAAEDCFPGSQRREVADSRYTAGEGR